MSSKRDIDLGTWVRQQNNRGLVVGEALASAGERIVWVKWLPAVQKTDAGRLRLDTPFSSMSPVQVAAGGLEAIEEPHLDREEAAVYVGRTTSRLYQLVNSGWFGAGARDPFWAMPSELDAYLAAPKATNRWEAKDVAKRQEKFKRSSGQSRQKKKDNQP
jgi:hypothetical protein